MSDISEYLKTVAIVVPSDIEGDKNGQHWVSKVDGSYVDRVGIEDEGISPALRKYGISDLQSSNNYKVASIGWCEKEQKWYGWSHRSIYGFGIGSEVASGDCAYKAKDEEDFLGETIRFWEDDYKTEVKGYPETQDGMKGVMITWVYGGKVKDRSLIGRKASFFHPYPDRWGRGEWTAKTLGDAKQMAMDFASGVA